MLVIAKHIKLVALLIISLFVLGSSGVAFVLQTYSMPPKMECCKMMSDGAASECAEHGQLANTVSLQPDMSCNTSTLVGGYRTNPGVVENDQTVHKTPIVVAPVPDLVTSTPAINVFVSLSSFAENFSRPSVDKNVLNSTLLI